MNQSKIRLSNADKTVDLPGAEVIGISATADDRAPRREGNNTISTQGPKCAGGGTF